MSLDPPYETREETFEVFGRRASPGRVRADSEYTLDVVMGARGGATFADAFDGDRRWSDRHRNGRADPFLLPRAIERRV